MAMEDAPHVDVIIPLDVEHQVRKPLAKFGKYAPLGLSATMLRTFCHRHQAGPIVHISISRPIGAHLSFICRGWLTQHTPII